MFPDESGAAETAIEMADRFAEAGLAKLDAMFGAGYAREHPAALGAYLAACASNLNACMMAATSIDDDAFGEALAAFESFQEQPAAKAKGRRR